MCDLQNKWVPPLYEEVPQTLQQMHEEGKQEEQRDPEQRKGRSVTKDQTTQTEPERDESKDSPSHTKGPADWHQRRARSLTRPSDRLVHHQNRCRSDGCGVNHFRHASHSENWHFWNDGGQSSGKLKERSSDYDDWCRRRAHNSSYEGDQLVHFTSRPQGEGYRASPTKQASQCDNCGCRNDPGQDGVKHANHSDAENGHKGTACSSAPHAVLEKSRCQSVGPRAHRFPPGSEREECGARNDRSQDGVKQRGRSSDAEIWRKRTAAHQLSQSEQPVIRQDRCHCNAPSGNNFNHASDCEIWCSRNDQSRDERSSDLDNWLPTAAQSERPLSNTHRPHGNARGFDPFKQASYCEKCSRDSVKLSDCDNWRNRRAHNSYRPGVHFVINKNWRRNNRYWIYPFKRATHVRNWRARSGRSKYGFKDSGRSSYCKNWHRRNPLGLSRYAIWAIFNRTMSHKTHGNRQAGAQFKSDCVNWRSWNDHRDHVDRRKRSPEDKNWHSMGDCVRDQVELCDRFPARDVTAHGECDEQRVADSNKDRKEAEVQITHGSDTGRKVPVKTRSASNGARVKEVQLS